MASDGTEECVRVDIEFVVSVADADALREAAIRHVTERGTWTEGPQATAEQRQFAIFEINADLARAVQTLVNADYLISCIPGVQESQLSIGARTVIWNEMN
jgi:hypothetical protein